jgi:hypothetical protein
MDSSRSDLVEGSGRRRPTDEELAVNLHSGQNPFEIPAATDVYGRQKASARRKKENWKKIKKMPIGDRATLHAPPISHRAVRMNYERTLSRAPNQEDGGIRPATEIRQRQQHATRLIQDQREIFISNLLIERQEKELSRIQSQKQTKAGKLVELESEWKASQNNTRTTTGQDEAMKIRARQKHDAQKKKRIDAEAQVKQRSRAIVEMETQIMDLEEKLAQYRARDALLADIERFEQRRPSTTIEFLEFFEHLESESLFVITNVENFRRQEEQSVDGLDAEEKIVMQSIAETCAQIAQAELEKSRTVKLKHPRPSANDGTDAGLLKLQQVISIVFHQCYPAADPSQTALTMLCLMEAKLEAMTRKLKYIDPVFFTKKMRSVALEKRAKQRELNLEKKMKDQAMKLEQMLERATKPVKRREGRPLCMRIAPVRILKTDGEKLLKEQLEKERVDSLLYGPIFA